MCAHTHTHAHTHTYIWLHAHMYEHMHACTAYIRRTRAVVQATHSVTHTKSYQVIHQLIGTNNVQILRETGRAEKAEPAPAPQLYHSAHPTPPRIFCHILARSPPRPAECADTWPAAQPALVWPAARTAPQQLNSLARGGPLPAPRRALICI